MKIKAILLAALFSAPLFVSGLAAAAESGVALDRAPIVLPDRRFALARRDGGPSSPMGEMGAA